MVLYFAFGANGSSKIILVVVSYSPLSKQEPQKSENGPLYLNIFAGYYRCEKTM